MRCSAGTRPAVHGLRRILTRRAGDTLLSPAAETHGETAAETVASVELDREDERPDDSRQSDASRARHSGSGYASCSGLQVCSDSVNELIAAFNWKRALSVRMGSIGFRASLARPMRHGAQLTGRGEWRGH
jgi:hypothetical protein